VGPGRPHGGGGASPTLAALTPLPWREREFFSGPPHLSSVCQLRPQVGPGGPAGAQGSCWSSPGATVISQCRWRTESLPSNDKLAQLHDRLLTQTEALLDSQDWREFLAVAARFHRYSANNVMLILAQAPQATRVAGYRRWQSLGRQVRKGERGIAILAPCVRRARPVDDEEETERPQLVRILRGFRVAHVEAAGLGDVLEEATAA